MVRAPLRLSGGETRCALRRFSVVRGGTRGGGVVNRNVTPWLGQRGSALISMCHPKRRSRARNTLSGMAANQG